MPDGEQQFKYSMEDIAALPNVNSKASFIQDLKTKGYCVVPNVLPKERCEQYCEDSVRWLEEFGLGFKRDDKSTWTEDHLPVGHRGGLYNAYACAHEDFIWRVRSEPGVIKCFEELWGTHELIVSFDAFNVTLPWGENGRKDIEWVDPWPHQDQDPHKPTFQLAQGLVACSESGPDDGGLCVLEGSHLLHQQFFAENGLDESRPGGKLNSYVYHQNEADWFRAHGCKDVKINCSAGSVIMWDSRLIHWNRMPTSDRIRTAIYVCYVPRSHATPEQLKRKAEIFHERMVATHWPALNEVKALKFGGPMRNGKPDPYDRSRPVREPEETDTVLKLAGIMEY